MSAHWEGSKAGNEPQVRKPARRGVRKFGLPWRGQVPVIKTLKTPASLTRKSGSLFFKLDETEIREILARFNDQEEISV